MKTILCLSLLLTVGTLKAMIYEDYLELNEELEEESEEYLEPEGEFERNKLIKHLETALKLNAKFDATFKDLKTDEEAFEFAEYCYETIAELNSDETQYICPISDFREEEKDDLIWVLTQMRQYYEEYLLTPENKALFCTLPNHIQSYYQKNFNYKKLTDNLFKIKYLWIAKVFNALLMKAIKIKDKKQVETLLKKYNYKSDHKKFTTILLYAIKRYLKTKLAYIAIIRNLLNAGATIVIRYPDPNPAIARYWIYGKESNSQKERTSQVPGIVCSSLAYESEILGGGPGGLKAALKKHKDFLLQEIRCA